MQNNQNPLVSIVIPVYNGANYMREAIDSALSQTYENIEVLVVNDGSTDNGATEKIALSYGSRIRYFYKENGGVSSALNLGIREMRGEYFSWLSHDDVYTKEKILCQIETLNRLSKPDALCYCRCVHIDKDSQEIKSKEKGCGFNTNEIIDYKKVLLNLFKCGSYNGCGFLIPQKIFTDNNLFFDEHMRYSQDVFMWYQIFLRQNCLVVADCVGVKGRIHGKQLSQTGNALFKKDSLSICNLLIDDIIANSSKEYNFVFYYIMDNAKHGNKAVVKIGIKKAKLLKKLSAAQRAKIRLFSIYGSVRPFIRKVYYRLFKHVKTN